MNPRCNCKASTDIADNITYGTGKLDEYGFWQFPCPHRKPGCTRCGRERCVCEELRDS